MERKDAMSMSSTPLKSSWAAGTTGESTPGVTVNDAIVPAMAAIDAITTLTRPIDKNATDVDKLVDGLGVMNSSAITGVFIGKLIGGPDGGDVGKVVGGAVGGMAYLMKCIEED